MAKVCPTPMPFRAVIGTVVMITLLFFYTFVARFIFSPLFPVIGQDVGLGAGQAGTLFLLGGFGALVGSFLAGLISVRLQHRGSLLLTTVGMAATLTGAYFADSLWALRVVFILLGFFAGVHLPSSVATITGTVKPDDWGAALSVQQMGPPLALVAAPLLAAGLLMAFAWNVTLLWVAGLGIVLLLLFMFGFGGIGAFPGDAPSPKLLKPVVANRSFWVMTFLFALGIGAQVGIYTMLPLYLVQERDMATGYANTVLGLANIAPLAVVFLSGWITKRLGPRPTMSLFLGLTGVSVVLVGRLSGPGMVVCVFLTAAFAVGFFAPAFAALSRIVQPTLRSLAAGYAPPVGYLLGAGLLPALLGYVAQARSFSLGITITGAVILVGSAATVLLRLLTDLDEGC